MKAKRNSVSLRDGLRQSRQEQNPRNKIRLTATPVLSKYWIPREADSEHSRTVHELIREIWTRLLRTTGMKVTSMRCESDGARVYES